jgi:hypothetical protein
MIAAIPLTILPLIAFNLIAFNVFGSAGADPWSAEVFNLTLISGARWSVPFGDLLIVFAIAMLFVEVLKSARASSRTIINHMISTLVLIAYVVEFIVVRSAAHSVFFILLVIALFDVLAGFSITIKTATRDVNFGGGV